MVKIVTFLLPILMAASQPVMDKNEIVKRVEKRFESMNSFTAGFRQTFFNASLGEMEESQGEMAVKKPLKMSWKYNKPLRQTIISDGKSIYFYVPKDKQVMVEKLGNMFTSRSPALFLAGNRKLSELFNIDLDKTPNKDRINGQVALSLLPKEESISVTRIVVRVDPEDFTIRSFTLYDWAGNRTEIEFFDMKINEEISDSVFKFEKPKGVEQVEMPNIDFGVR